ncbi:MAG: MoaD/ThiS family protein [Anaerolineae bacterium]|nr:MoaD/ThiS family protein [Anaerolineae bacterium]MDW8067814.1 MoaD/ThiS family protein [Anaerolineae bacterium]
MIRVKVKLFATLRRYYPELGIGEGIEVELPEGATVGQLVNHLGLPADHVRVVFINGIARDESHLLSDGDEIGVFPPVGGG